MKKNIITTSLMALLILTSTNILADELLDRINNHGTVSIGTEGTYPPFTYHDKSGKLTGYDVEVARAVAKKLGYKIDFRETQWDSMFAGLKGGRFDMIANQISLTTPQRRATFDKTDNYSYSSTVIVDRKGDRKFKLLSDIKGLTSAQTLSSHYGELAIANGAKVIPVDGMAQSLTLIQQKRADLTINDALAVLDYLKSNSNSKLQIAWRDNEHRRGAGFGLNKGHPEVVKKINQALTELRQDGTLKKLSIQFFGEDATNP